MATRGSGRRVTPRAADNGARSRRGKNDSAVAWLGFLGAGAAVLLSHRGYWVAQKGRASQSFPASIVFQDLSTSSLGELDIVAAMPFYRPAYKSRGRCLSYRSPYTQPYVTSSCFSQSCRLRSDTKIPSDHCIDFWANRRRVALHTPSAKVVSQCCLEPRGLPSKAQNRRTAERAGPACRDTLTPHVRGESRDAPTSLQWRILQGTHGLASETTYLVRYVGGALAALGPCSGAGSADLDTEQLLGFAGAEMQSADSRSCLSMQQS